MLYMVYYFSDIFNYDVVMNMHLKVVIAAKRSVLDVCSSPEYASQSSLTLFFIDEWASISELVSRPSKIY